MQPASSDSGSPSAPRRILVPSPADLRARVATRAVPLQGPPPYGIKHALDTGVGIAFESVGQFDLLAAYMADVKLFVLDDVVVEIRRRANLVLEDGHDKHDKRVKDACAGLLRRIENDGVMERAALGQEFYDAVAQVQIEVAGHSGASHGHDGEAATIVWADSQRPRALILTNDGGAQQVADARGLHWRNAAQVMAALVDGGKVAPDVAFALVEKMNDTSGIAGPYPVDARWRAKGGAKLF